MCAQHFSLQFRETEDTGGGDNGKSEVAAEDSVSCLDHPSKNFEWATSYTWFPLCEAQASDAAL